MFTTLSTRYGNPCRPAAALLEKILLDPAKRSDWEKQLRSMVTRVQGVRRQLRQRLEALVPAYNWESITQQVSHYNSFPAFSRSGCSGSLG